jgi:hypothetical protein
LEKRLIIRSKSIGQVEAVVAFENPKTAAAVLNVLPLKERANRWGDEVYFGIPVDVKEENARAEVEVGSVAYWPPGHALCIFFGPTPASRGNEPRAASPVNVFAQVVGDVGVLKRVRDGEEVTVLSSD